MILDELMRIRLTPVLYRFHGTGLFRALLTTLFGILIGLLIGYCFEFNYFYDYDDFNHISFHHNKFQKKFADNETFILNIYLQCIVLIQPDTNNQNHFVTAILDTYSRRCNETIFFTNSEELVKEFGGVFK